MEPCALREGQGVPGTQGGIDVRVLPGFHVEGFAPEKSAASSASSAVLSIGLLELPRHMMEKWATVKEAMEVGTDPNAISDRFAGFARAVTDLLHFKKVALPQECRCNLLQIPPGLVAMSGEGFSSTGMPHLHLVIHLGEKAAPFTFDLPQISDPGHLSVEGASAGAATDSVSISLEPGQGYLYRSQIAGCGVCVTSPELMTLLMLAGVG